MNDREGLRALQRRVLPFAERHAAMLLFLPIVWWLASQTHRLGHSWGDDFALYLRQARSVLDGNIGQVIADNHFNVTNAAKPGFSPYVYPWGWPLVLAPFVRFFGLDYARLKTVEVACLCGFLWTFHEVIRARAARWVAFGVVVCLGTTLAYLLHTDHLVSELPYMWLVAITFWWLDRCRHHHQLDRATRRQLIVLGLLTVAVFNVRREGLAIVPAIAAVQLLDLRGRWRAADLRRAATPYVTFAAGVVLFQLLLPSALAPSYDDAGLHQTWKKLQGPFRTAFAEQLGLPSLHGAALLLVVLVVVAGVAVRLWRAPKQDLPLVVFAVGSMVIVGMIPAVADRYLLAITPFAVYFAAQALAAIPLPRSLPPHSGRWLAVAALGTLTIAHLPAVADEVRAATRSRDRGEVVDGPEAAYVQPAWEAIRTLTHQDDVVAFFKVRALTFYTDRRGVQSSELPIVQQRADFFMMRRNSRFSQPLVTPTAGAAMGWDVVWEDDNWVLWRVRMPSG